MTYQFDQLHRSLAEEEEPLHEEEVRVLSQRLSQLSAKNDDEREPSKDGKRQRVSSPNPNPKKVRVDVDHPPGSERIPTYLSTDRLMSLNIDMPSYLPIEDLQRLGFCLHQLAVLPIEDELWTGYRECGTGLWRDEQSIPNHSHFWPHHVKSSMPTKPTDGNEQHAYENVVHQHLREIHSQLVRYQQEYEDKQRTLAAEIPALEETLQQLVHEQAAIPLRMKVDMALVVLRYDDEDHWLQCQYQAANSTDYQVRVMNTCSPTIISFMFRSKWPSLCTRQPFRWSSRNANWWNIDNVCYVIDHQPCTITYKSQYLRRWIRYRGTNSWFNKRRRASWQCIWPGSKRESINTRRDSENKPSRCGSNIVSMSPTEKCHPY